MKSLKQRLSLTLMSLFLVIGLILAYITRHASVQFNLEMTQRLNGSIAMYVAAEEQLIANGQVNQAAIQRLAERAMVINPTVEVYLLDTAGRILSHNLPADVPLAGHIPLAQINEFLQPESHRPLVNLDPRSPATAKAFSAAKVTHNGQHQGYVYAILGGQAYETLANDLSKNFVLSVALASMLAVWILGYLVALLVVNKLTNPLTALTRKVRQFEQQMTGKPVSQLHIGDEIQALDAAFGHMQDKIQSQVKSIQAADQNRRDLITHVSHDLRTPLAAIQGYIDTLLVKDREFDEEQRARHLSTASKHCQRLNSLIHDLFELSKLDALAVTPQIEAFSLSELMQDVSLEFKWLARQKNIALKVDLFAGPCVVRADIGLMQRVLENLISNAIRHTPEDGQIWLRLVTTDQQFKVIIKDTGRGISNAELPYIFDRLYQGQNTASRADSSTGLGLAIVKKIMDLHQLKIKVISQLEKGTQFSFNIPQARLS
ncbi:sensor histidine kinase [Marinicella sediminis]|uniref:histidine kinase n=1 Tax=Marinicella sediminis TaxID=1792834 RepID=A0ABV7JCP6_9GAMM|nr:ATP-binding protein [Marinicella sediminis]